MMDIKRNDGSVLQSAYGQKLSASITYGLVSAIALNVFWQPGKVYASGITGFAQLIDNFLAFVLNIHIPISVVIYGINVPLFVLAWFKLGRKFTIFTILSVTISALMIQIVPQVPLTTDPLICAIFGGAINGLGVGFAMRNGVSSGGLDIISLYIRKKTGKSVGAIAIIFNAFIILAAGFLFGWPHALYSMFSIFISGKMTDAVYTRQQKMQAMIITRHPQRVTDLIQAKMRRGITLIHGAEGAYRHESQTILITVITRYELPQLSKVMKEADPHAFVSIADNVKILGNFYDPGMD